jgi:ribosome biogenesis protein Tsr3
LFKPEEFLDTTDKKSATEVDMSGIKCVYFNKLKRSWQHPIPILVSTNAMLYGGEKQAMLQSAEKVVYYTATTYDKEATTIAGKIDN